MTPIIQHPIPSIAGHPPERVDIKVPAIHLENMSEAHASRFRSALERELAHRLTGSVIANLTSFTRGDGRVVDLRGHDFGSPERLASALAKVLAREISG